MGSTRRPDQACSHGDSGVPREEAEACKTAEAQAHPFCRILLMGASHRQAQIQEGGKETLPLHRKSHGQKCRWRRGEELWLLS